MKGAISIQIRVICAFIFAAITISNSYTQITTDSIRSSPDKTGTSILEKKYNFNDNRLPFSPMRKTPLLFLQTPPNISQKIEYDPDKNDYKFSEKIGSLDYKLPYSMSLNDYKKYEFQNSKKEYWRQRSKSETVDRRSPLLKSINVGGETFDKIFGTSTISIVPQGSAELIFGINTSKINNPNISERLRKTTTFDFREKIQMNVNGSIGDKMKLGVNYNTEASFDFENKTKLEYNGKEDEIIKKIEAGNVSLPLTGSLITGSQSLFGLKTEMQFGKLYVTTVLSQQKGESSVIEVKGGAQQQEFELPIDQYDADKHFFLAQYFRNNYENALASLPTISSGITITKIEVWVTNKSSSYENTRNIVALMDLGEKNVYNSVPEFQPNVGIQMPSNEINGLYKFITDSSFRDINSIVNKFSGFSNFASGQDFEKVENARKLTEREYTFNSALGYISLNTALRNGEVLGVAYEYIYRGKTYRVGELSNSGIVSPKSLFVKLIKATNLTPNLPTWDLMMKNVYAIGAYQVTNEDFELNIVYQDDKTGNAINYIPEKLTGPDTTKKILIRALGMDKLNSQQDPVPDGVFDYVKDITINESNGRVFFTTLEPFGTTLKKYLIDNNLDSVTWSKYVFQELYDDTQTKARLSAERNKFKINGRFQSASSSEISLNAMNVPQGSVVVTAGGIKLSENIDYSVDYMTGRVKILNLGLLESGTPIKISLESNSLFNIQTKTLVGTHLDYKFSDNFIIGGTILHLSERPLTTKVNIGDEPISNTIWGINGTYTTKSQFLTSVIDKLPFLQTKEPSSFTFEGEFAHLIPGHSKAIKKAGTAYIDDFEGSETSYEMKSFTAWSLASTPQGQNDLFPEAALTNNLKYGYNRAKLAWYVIDPLFLRNTSSTPAHIKNNNIEKTSPFVREVQERDIFKNVSNPSNLPSTLQILNIAYYPQDKGPYNYDTNMSAYGKLLAPKERWGGIMREVQTNDFEAANVQFIEFWVMDPFVEDTLSTNSGKLYFNLGDVSEDILRDSRKTFENGYPKSEVVDGVDTTAWGRVPDATSQPLTNSFDNDPNSRKFQDVGLDGLGDEEERIFFQNYINSIRGTVTDQVALDKIILDPSNDDFHYYRGSDYDQERLGILERYKRYNGYEGNSPALETNSTASGSSLPNSEDINRDNTLNEGESYYQYSVDISVDALKEVGKNYITDIVQYPLTDVETEEGKKTVNVRWLQFRIPISEPEKVVGSIQDFKSIRFMRMFLKGFQDSVIFRFAKLELVRGEWRKYDLSMRQGGEGVSNPEESDGTFEITSVNIEENSDKTPVNYVLPPGIDRVIDPQNPQLTELNEQSMVLKVQDLVNGDARAAYKTMNLDIRQYKRLQMEVHAEQIPGNTINDDELTLFIRMGSDYRNNYYEIEIPLKLTPQGSYINEDDKDRRIVWPEANRIDFALEDFQRIKQARNDMMRASGSSVTFSTVFPFNFDESPYTYYICGNPNLSNVRTMMIGVRYPKSPGNQGLTRSAEVWVNELRLTNFNEKGGWAANARVITKLADLGTLSIAGSTLKPGFGSIDQKVNERSKEEINTYDISSNLELGKFFPEKSGIQIPMYVGYSESFTDPEYNPLDPDIPLQAALDNAGSKEERNRIIKNARDYVMRRSLNFTNVRINKQDGKPHFYDISNWSVNYAFNETYSHNINIERNLDKRYNGGILYNYTGRPKLIQPFQKVKFLNSKYFRLIKDFNFNLGPTTLGFSTEMSRHYREITNRDINRREKIDAVVSKDFLWNRNYEFSYDLTRSIKIDFTATNIARIDEPGSINIVNRYFRDDYQIWKDSVWRSIKKMGRTTEYYHDINLTYSLPINKIPFLDWTNSSVRYNASYGWDVAPINYTYDLGNTIKNSNTLQLSSQFTLTTLYNKVPFFKRLLQPANKNAVKKKKTKKVIYERTNMVLKSDEPRIIFHKLSTEDVTVKFFNKDNQEIKGKTEIINENRISFLPDSNVNNVRVLVEGTVEVNPSPLIFIFENTTRLLLGFKNVSFTYSQTQGTLLPGYRPNTRYFGMENFNGMFAPGLPFILGYQDKDFARKAARDYNWLTTSEVQNNPFRMTHNETFNGRANFEPFSGLKIELNAMRTYSRNESSYWTGDFSEATRGFQRDGNFSMSVISIGSAFEKHTIKNYESSPSFDKFKSYRFNIMNQLSGNRKNLDPNNYDPTNNDGYNEFSQQVLIPAFLAAYGGFDPKNVTLKSIPSYLKMRPNWRITFDGLSKLDFIKKYIRTININHSYKATYNIGSYISNPDFFANGDIEAELSNLRDLQNNFIGPLEINSVSINEQFGPLVNVDIAWKNSLLTRFELRKSRNVILSLSSYQITETSTNDIVIGSGYKFKDVQFIINSGDGQRSFKSDLNLTADVSIRDNKVIIRKLEGKPQAAQGQNVVTIKFGADYNLSESFNLRFFYDRIVNKPFTSISYPTANTNIGISVRFTLVQ